MFSLHYAKRQLFSVKSRLTKLRGRNDLNDMTNIYQVEMDKSRDRMTGEMENDSK
jgi:hypothetical protein